MPIEFRAAVLSAHTTDRPFAESRPLRIEIIRADGPAAHEVLVRIEAASLCRSDLSVITGVRAWPMPIVPGHEASGIVEEVGADVTRVVPGDRVVLVYQPQCGVCRCCLAGDAHLCEPGLAANRAGRLLSGGPRLSHGGSALHHHMGLSAFAERAVVAEHSLVRVDPDLDPDIAALFGCAAMCGAGSVVNTGRARPGESVCIVAVDLNPAKLEQAIELGATDTVQGGPDAAAEILAATSGGVDLALETAGTVEAFSPAYTAARRGGRIVSVGLVNPATPYALDVAAHVTGAKTIAGSYMGSCNPALDIPKLVALHRADRFPVEKLITHRMPFADVNTALDRMADSAALRQILHPAA